MGVSGRLRALDAHFGVNQGKAADPRRMAQIFGCSLAALLLAFGALLIADHGAMAGALGGGIGVTAASTIGWYLRGRRSRT